MSITERSFGKTTLGEEVKIFTSLNSRGMKVEIMELGAAVVSMVVPNKMGKLADVALGFESVEKYEKQTSYMGAIVGRCANRLEKGEIKLNGVKYKLVCNDGKNHLHGGLRGFDKSVWTGEIKELNGVEWLEMNYRSVHMEEGYPGNLDVSVSYFLTDNNSLEIEYFAISDQDTAVNLTNHTYFNLKGHNEGDILDHELQLFCKEYTENGTGFLPNGKISSVAGTRMDFTEKKKIAEEFDDNWVLPEGKGGLVKCAILSEESSGRTLEVHTTMPGIQLYTGNFLANEVAGKNGAEYWKHSGLCLETQYFPNSMKHKDFPSIVLPAFEKYRHKTVYRFR